MLAGGVAAYWGDRVGQAVGKKRLSVFGLRPKYTSRVVAVATGVLIVLFTLTTLIISQQRAHRAVWHRRAPGQRRAALDRSGRLRAQAPGARRGEIWSWRRPTKRWRRSGPGWSKSAPSSPGELASLQQRAELHREQLSLAREELQSAGAKPGSPPVLGRAVLQRGRQPLRRPLRRAQGRRAPHVPGGRHRGRAAHPGGAARGLDETARRLVERGLGDPGDRGRPPPRPGDRTGGGPNDHVHCRGDRDGRRAKPLAKVRRRATRASSCR